MGSRVPRPGPPPGPARRGRRGAPRSGTRPARRCRRGVPARPRRGDRAGRSPPPPRRRAPGAVGRVRASPPTGPLRHTPAPRGPPRPGPRAARSRGPRHPYGPGSFDSPRLFLAVLADVDVVDRDVDLGDLQAGHSLHGGHDVAADRLGEVHDRDPVVAHHVQVDGGLPFADLDRDAPGDAGRGARNARLHRVDGAATARAERVHAVHLARGHAGDLADDRVRDRGPPSAREQVGGAVALGDGSAPAARGSGGIRRPGAASGLAGRSGAGAASGATAAGGRSHGVSSLTGSISRPGHSMPPPATNPCVRRTRAWAGSRVTGPCTRPPAHSAVDRTTRAVVGRSRSAAGPSRHVPRGCTAIRPIAVDRLDPADRAARSGQVIRARASPPGRDSVTTGTDRPRPFAPDWPARTTGPRESDGLVRPTQPVNLSESERRSLRCLDPTRVRATSREPVPLPSPSGRRPRSIFISASVRCARTATTM
ncbi:hypothetical protein FRACA_760007 [Frankia canadensis]|uniref:Uncharacterized protein n=1 Tax=Frankia canadensis TaxID=1836972 RepID=A0A2I2L110_9ACTN|nr:hypothetical protein FRACA_760007 [Frankia canadensis]SOU58888.1 hypothetical protein FRACA_760007 [Frankia canadensis]